MKHLLLLGLTLFSLVGIAAEAPPTEATPRAGFHWSEIESLAIQSRGRVKPLDTYAAEMVQFVTGTANWKNFRPVEVLFSWLISYDTAWDKTPFLRIDYVALKKELKLDPDAKFFSPSEIQGNADLRRLVQAATKRQQGKEKLTEMDKKAMQVQNQIGVVGAIVRGEDLTILPNPKGINENWFPIATLTNHATLVPYPSEQMDKVAVGIRSLIEAYAQNDAAKWNQAAIQVNQLLRGDVSNGAYPSVASLNREISYNHLRPFRWAWALYALAFVLLLFYNTAPNKISRTASIVALAGAVGIHSYGFVVRILISGRPPVTNMYESIIWVTWGCMIFSLLIWANYKNAVIPTAASVFAVVGLVLADNLPSVLDPNIHPLEPVLRSNFWLTIHVLTITLSYAAFALSLCLGNVVLGNYLFTPKNTKRIQNLTLYMYRAVQIGVVLLAAGTILGGIWADYSWGRFWGWDPKEVWALIALLLYLAVLHGRFTGWLRGFGFATATVMCYLGVLMAWYGVNFVLGVGLHSYGFGSGGISYMATYVSAQLLFIGAAYYNYSKHFPKGAPKAAIFPK